MIPFLMKANRFLNHVGGNNNSQVAKFVVDLFLMLLCQLKKLLRFYLSLSYQCFAMLLWWRKLQNH
jgi:hypothetical protein